MKFSIILPTKDNTRTIKKCLDSILNQDYKNIEVIFVDNFSDDSTYDIAKSFEGKIDIKVFKQGPERNIQRHFGYEKTSGDIVYFLDSDMYLEKGLISEAINKFNNDDKLGGLIIPEKNVDGNGYWTKVKAFERSFYDGDDSIEAARIFRREVYDNVGGYNKDLISGEDWDLSDRIREIAKIDRIKTFVWHDEGEVKFIKLLKKKFYYGSKFIIDDGGSNKNTTGILSKIYFFRPVFYTKWREYLKKPMLFPGFIIMITFELIAGGFGFILSRVKK